MSIARGKRVLSFLLLLLNMQAARVRATDLMLQGTSN